MIPTDAGPAVLQVLYIAGVSLPFEIELNSASTCILHTMESPMTIQHLHLGPKPQAPVLDTERLSPDPLQGRTCWPRC